MRTGVVVAGGRSTRFGSTDKAVADLAGTPLVRRVSDRLAKVCDVVVVNGRRDQRTAIESALRGLDAEWRYAVDTDPGSGPVAGIRTGLAATSGEYAAVVACDMPFVDPSFLEYLFRRASGAVGERSYEAALARPDEWFQPLQAVYGVSATLDACDAALSAGEARVMAVVERLDAVVVERAELATHAAADTFENVNTRADLAEAAAKIAGEDSPPDGE